MNKYKRTLPGKRYLQAIRAQQGKINELLLLERKMRYDLLPSAITYDRDKIQTSPSDVFSDKMVATCSLLDEIDDRIARIEVYRLEALALINQVKKKYYRDILTQYYTQTDERYNLLRWRDIAEGLGRREDTIRQAHGRALLVFNDIYIRHITTERNKHN